MENKQREKSAAEAYREERKQRMAKAAKKSGRATSEGLVTVATSADGMHIAMGSLLCETDFVARGEQFEALAAKGGPLQGIF